MPGHTEPRYSLGTWPVAFPHRMACKTTVVLKLSYDSLPTSESKSGSKQWDRWELWVSGVYLPIAAVVFNFLQGTICTPFTLVPVEQLLRDGVSLSWATAEPSGLQQRSSKCHLVILKSPVGPSKSEDIPHNKITIPLKKCYFLLSLC